MNKEKCIKIVFIMLLALFGYITLSIGCLSVSLQKTFQLYNDKFDHLQKLILDLKQEPKNDKRKNDKIKENKVINVQIKPKRNVSEE